MKRREFLKGGAALTALAGLARTNESMAVEPGFAPRPAAWRNFEITTRIEIPPSPGPVRAWIPLPSIDAGDWIRTLGDDWQAEGGTVEVRVIAPYGARLLRMEWANGTSPVGVVKSRIATRDRFVDLGRRTAPRPLSAGEHDLYTAATKQIPTDGIVARTSSKIVSGARSDLEKSRRLYEWIVANTFRDPKVRGCGLGDITFMLKTGYLGGKCADLNALFVGLARAAGIPARDLYGIRVAPSNFGYKSLGANSETITKAQHCRAEVYLSEFGWIPVDPADVRKVALEEPPGNLPLTADKVEAAHRTLFGAWESNWIAYNAGHDIALPGSKGPALPFLMYPQAETTGERRDCLDADAFKYVITAKEFAA
jgi:transglutaminase-like putative cysteine protease